MEKYNFESYLQSAKSQLTCNASDEYKSKYITYSYNDEQIDENVDYFKKCFESGLSSYKALLFFFDYLNGNYAI